MESKIICIYNNTRFLCNHLIGLFVCLDISADSVRHIQLGPHYNQNIINEFILELRNKCYLSFCFCFPHYIIAIYSLVLQSDQDHNFSLCYKQGLTQYYSWYSCLIYIIEYILWVIYIVCLFICLIIFNTLRPLYWSLALIRNCENQSDYVCFDRTKVQNGINSVNIEINFNLDLNSI